MVYFSSSFYLFSLISFSVPMNTKCLFFWGGRGCNVLLGGGGGASFQFNCPSSFYFLPCALLVTSTVNSTTCHMLDAARLLLWCWKVPLWEVGKNTGSDWIGLDQNQLLLYILCIVTRICFQPLIMASEHYLPNCIFIR